MKEGLKEAPAVLSKGLEVLHREAMISHQSGRCELPFITETRDNILLCKERQSLLNRSSHTSARVRINRDLER